VSDIRALIILCCNLRATESPAATIQSLEELGHLSERLCRKKQRFQAGSLRIKAEEQEPSISLW